MLVEFQNALSVGSVDGIVETITLFFRLDALRNWSAHRLAESPQLP